MNEDALFNNEEIPANERHRFRLPLDAHASTPGKLIIQIQIGTRKRSTTNNHYNEI